MQGIITAQQNEDLLLSAIEEDRLEAEKNDQDKHYKALQTLWRKLGKFLMTRHEVCGLSLVTDCTL